jgi:deaminated glutathione amidase
MRAAAIQLNANDDVVRNVKVAERLVRAAAADGAELVCLPEKWTVLGDSDAMQEGAEPLDGPSIGAARGWALELQIHLVAGSFAERVEGREKLHNTSVLIDPEGEIVAVYRKIHMFDVEVGGVTYRESEHEKAGDEIVTAPVEDVKLGMTVCYDLRFPELYRILAVRGAQVISVPSAFTRPTGEAHWEVLLRARAIENQCFVVGANQFGQAPPHYESWGHSMIVGPWGEVLVAAEKDEECFIAADLDFARQEEIRTKLPSLANRQPRAYKWPEEVKV